MLSYDVVNNFDNISDEQTATTEAISSFIDNKISDSILPGFDDVVDNKTASVKAISSFVEDKISNSISSFIDDTELKKKISGFIENETDPIFKETFNDISGKIVFEDELKTVAFSGSYNDLNDKPQIPTNVSQLSDAEKYALKTQLFSKSYNDLNDKPEIPNVPEWALASSKPSYTWTEINEKPIATSITLASEKDIPTCKSVIDFVENKFKDINVDVDLTDYYTKSEVDGLIPEVPVQSVNNMTGNVVIPDEIVYHNSAFDENSELSVKTLNIDSDGDVKYNTENNETISLSLKVVDDMVSEIIPNTIPDATAVSNYVEFKREIYFDDEVISDDQAKCININTKNGAVIYKNGSVSGYISYPIISGNNWENDAANGLFVPSATVPTIAAITGYLKLKGLI